MRKKKSEKHLCITQDHIIYKRVLLIDAAALRTHETDAEVEIERYS